MTEHKPLVELNQRKFNSAGAIYCLPGAGDGVTNFISFVETLSSDLTVYGLQPIGLIGDQQPYASIEVMVEKYVEAILSKNHSGPCYLLGHSFGGIVALEIARKLTTKHYEVAPLVLLDSSLPENRHIHQSRVESLLDLVEAMELVSKHSFDLPLEVLEPLNDETQLQLLHERMIATGMLPKQTNVDSIRGMVRVFIANMHMEYFPNETYEGDALLVNALDTKESNHQRCQNFERWRKLIPSLEYRESPGNHMTLLRKGYVETLVNIVETIWGL